MSDYTRWYRVGTVALTRNSKIVTGTGTFWLAAGLNPGDLFTVDASQFYEVQSIDSNTQLTLKTAYSAAGTSETEYAIVRNFTASLPAQVAAQTADLLNDFRQFVDLKMQSIHGKSAYQIAAAHGYTGTESQWLEDLQGDSPYDLAVKNGYNGTESEWLETLKAGGEWTQADERIATIETFNNETLLAKNYRNKNYIYRGKNLGAFTEDMYAEIHSGRNTGLFVGDSFTINGHRYTIAGWGPYGQFKGYGCFLLYTSGMTPEMCAPFSNKRSSEAIGTEGEEGYIPAARGEYMVSNWYVNLRPIFINMIETDFGADRVKELEITVPTGHNGSAVSSVVTSTSKAHLPTYEMLTGRPIFAPTYTATGGLAPFAINWGPHRYMQLPYFQFVREWSHYTCAEALLGAYDYLTDGFVIDQFVSAHVHLGTYNQCKPVFVIA